jgi:hypothetical protein
MMKKPTMFDNAIPVQVSITIGSKRRRADALPFCSGASFLRSIARRSSTSSDACQKNK